MSASVSFTSRIRGSFLGMAVCDALGGPVEFKPRNSVPRVTSMLPNANFGIPAGCFTDDTSMALCLARSLLDCDGQHNVIDQVKKYIAWSERGYMSSTGECFDIGTLTSNALSVWSVYLANANENEEQDHQQLETTEKVALKAQKEVTAKYSREMFCGNGSLMRVLPVALITQDRGEAIGRARKSSLPTHPHIRCQHACTIYVSLVMQALGGASKNTMAKNLARSVENKGKPNAMTGEEDLEPVLKERLERYRSIKDWRSTPSDSIRSTGYVVDSLEAALWAFFSTENFEQGAIRAVNLGDDADTIGAIYGGLAGAFYSTDAIPKHWLADMKRIEIVDEIIEDIIEYRILKGE